MFLLKTERGKAEGTPAKFSDSSLSSRLYNKLCTRLLRNKLPLRRSLFFVTAFDVAVVYDKYVNLVYYLQSRDVRISEYNLL